MKKFLTVSTLAIAGILILLGLILASIIELIQGLIIMVIWAIVIFADYGLIKCRVK